MKMTKANIILMCEFSRENVSLENSDSNSVVGWSLFLFVNLCNVMQQQHFSNTIFEFFFFSFFFGNLCSYRIIDNFFPCAVSEKMNLS